MYNNLGSFSAIMTHLNNGEDLRVMDNDSTAKVNNEKGRGENPGWSLRLI